jgi:1-hydroxy-2-naphthoate dioxygenase
MTASKAAGRAALDARLVAGHVRGQWQNHETYNLEPRDGPLPMGVPHVWKWPEVRANLSEAERVLGDALRQRRSLICANPALSGGTTHTFGVGIQLVTPAEMAWAHRHTMAAVRFGIEGSERLFTIVDGERVPMLAGDLILTPGLSWHEHINESDHDGLWLDAIDSPLMGALGQRWYEAYGERSQPPRSVTRTGVSYRYPWRDAIALLEQRASQGPLPSDGARLQYVDADGGSVLPTLGCSLQLLGPGLVTENHRHTASSAYFAVEGAGTTMVDGQPLHWSERDIFVIPNWMRFRHANASLSKRAVLLCVSDEPMLRALALYREDPQLLPQLAMMRLYPTTWTATDGEDVP